MKKKIKKESFFKGKKIEFVLLISFLFFLLLFIGMVVYYNLENSSNILDRLGEKCLESCKEDIVNFDWYLLSYTINEFEGTIQCDCIRKARDLGGYSQRRGVEERIVYLDLRTFEKINS